MLRRYVIQVTRSYSHGIKEDNLVGLPMIERFIRPTYQHPDLEEIDNLAHQAFLQSSYDPKCEYHSPTSSYITFDYDPENQNN